MGHRVAIKCLFLLHWISGKEHLTTDSWKKQKNGMVVNRDNIAAGPNRMGLVLQDKGMYDKAEGWNKASLKMLQRILGNDGDHLSISISLHLLGRVYHEKGMLEEAEK